MKAQTQSSITQLRIIGGDLRRRQLRFPSAPGLRPTPDRVRETLFNWLGQTIPGYRCLDLFAGSGALGFEAISRGADLVVAVEKSVAGAKALKENAALLGVADRLEVHCIDAAHFLGGERRQFDLVFLDPPFAEDWLSRLWPAVDRLVNAAGEVYVEAGAPFAAPEGWTVYRSDKAGAVHYHLLRRTHDPADDACRR